MHDPLSQMLVKTAVGLPWYVIMIVVVGIVMQAFKQSRPRRRSRRGVWQSRGKPRQNYFAKPEIAVVTPSRKPDAADQLRTVMASNFTAKPLLNRSETYVLKALEPLVAELLPGWRVMAQVSLGEVLKGDSVEAFNANNAKRVDFLLVDDEFRLRLVIEYQGQGHHQGTAAARDAVKKEALRRAGIGYGEVLAGDTIADLRALLAKLVPRPASASAA